MVTTKREDVTMQGFCKILRRKIRLRGSLSFVLIHFVVCVVGGRGCRVGVGGGRLSEFEWEGEGCGERVNAYSRQGAH